MGTFIRELVHVGLYKRNQGRITRQVSFAALAVTIALGLLRLSLTLAGRGMEYQFGVPLALLLAGLWVSYRVVNVPVFADFLIAVEAEMNKVSWPSRAELFRATIVVLIMIAFLALFLAGCDVIWRVVLTWGGII